MSIGRTYSLALVLASPSVETIRDSDHWEYDSLVGLVWDGRPPGMVVLCFGRTVDVHDSLGNGLCQWILLCLDSNRRCLKNYVPIITYSHILGREWKKRSLRRQIPRERNDDGGGGLGRGRVLQTIQRKNDECHNHHEPSPPSNLMLYTTGTTVPHHQGPH